MAGRVEGGLTQVLIRVDISPSWGMRHDMRWPMLEVDPRFLYASCFRSREGSRAVVSLETVPRNIQRYGACSNDDLGDRKGTKQVGCIELLTHRGDSQIDA